MGYLHRRTDWPAVVHVHTGDSMKHCPLCGSYAEEGLPLVGLDAAEELTNWEDYEDDD